MDIEAAAGQISARSNAGEKEQDAQGGGSIGEQMETGEDGQGWQEVRGRRAEKRAQGGSTGASPAKPEPQRRAVEASGGGSIAQQQDNSKQGGDADVAGVEQVKAVAEEARSTQQQPPRAAAPASSRAARRAKQVGGSIDDASTTTSGGLRDDGSESEESERSRGNVTTSSTGQIRQQLEKTSVKDGAAQVNVVGSSSSSRVATLCAGHASKGLADHGAGATHSTSERLNTFKRELSRKTSWGSARMMISRP